jgi:hypothetical protein
MCAPSGQDLPGVKVKAAHPSDGKAPRLALDRGHRGSLLYGGVFPCGETAIGPMI